MSGLEKCVCDAVMTAGAGSCALLDAASLAPMLDERQRERLETAVPGWRGILCAVVPYYAGDGEKADEARPRMSRYAWGKDYHVVVTRILEAGAAILREAGWKAAVWADASPIPEVWAAAACGLGVIGGNGLLLTGEWGSWVFIGCMATDAPLEFPSAREIGSCIGCGACVRACPVGAIVGGRVDAESCLSAVSQRGGMLMPREEALMRENGIIWGCDRCQEICPVNRNARQTGIMDFRKNLLYTIPISVREAASRKDLCTKWPDRAFTWKGVRVLQRNLGLFEQEKETKPV